MSADDTHMIKWHATKAELVGFDDIISKILWSKLFIEAQGFEVKANIVYRDNTISMRLEENGKGSSGKHTHHFHIKFFYITNLINRNKIQIKYCPTEDMIVDYMTTSLVSWSQASSNIFANSLWTSYLRQQSLPRLASRSVLDNISITHTITIFP